ncbi:MAG: DUF87 domain-containing protein [Acidipropionibacterium sp.]|jgi:hypothetical protein|nr:DUF87 domain-containing protein [Acidipropionibacterium sp.]
MASDLSGLLGLQSGAGTPGVDDVLKGLTIGPFREGRCAPPPVTTGYTWCQFTVLPQAEPGTPNPFDAVLSSMVGSRARLGVRIFHQDDGTGVFFGSDDPAAIGVTRSLLSPGVVSVPLDGAPEAPGAPAGLIFRVQAETGSAVPAGRWPALLERLAPIQGLWHVDFGLMATDSVAIMATRRSVEALADLAAEELSVTRRLTELTSSTSESAPWRRVLDWTRVYQDELTAAGAYGGWAVTMWITARDRGVLERVQAVMRGGLLDVGERRHIGYDLTAVAGGPPPASFLSSDELATMLRPPSRATPGLMVRKAPPGHIRPRVVSQPLALGSYPGSSVRATVAVDDLEGHAFITGTTGSGKTTTTQRLLAECWNRYAIPFLVIDPVKDDYSAASGLFDGGLTVVTGQDLRMDIMRAWPGEEPGSHIAQVAQAFRGSFTMPSPTPYVVTRLFDAVSLQSGGPEGSDLFDVATLLDGVVDSLGYAPEATSNIRATLRTRLETLLSPARAHRFAWTDSDLVVRLLDRPAVITLADVVDDEERSFLVLMLTLAVWAAARARGGGVPVGHLLVLEEAHRVIPDVAPDDDPETGSARRASAALLTNMLAEVRSLGEQIVIVDQSPSRVSSEVLRNTNLKVAHRLVHPTDQQAIAAAMGIGGENADLLGMLERGQAVISTRAEPLPQTVTVGAAPVLGPPHLRTLTTEGTPWPCDCAVPAEHYRARAAGRDAARPMALFLLGALGGSPSPRLLLQRVRAELEDLSTRSGARMRCLAWAGLRYVGAACRQSGALPSSAASEGMLRDTYRAWSEGALPRSPSGLNPAWFRALADGRFPRGSRTPLELLGRSDWGRSLIEIADWVVSRRVEYETLAAGTAVRGVLRALVERESLRHGLDPQEASDPILHRAGLDQEEDV